MATTFSVKSRVGTETAYVSANGQYIVDTPVIPTKELVVTANTAAGLPSDGGNWNLSAVYNFDQFGAGNVPANTKYLLTAIADGANGERVQLWAVYRSSTGTSDVEILLANLTPGETCVVPFRIKAADGTRNEFPIILAIREDLMGVNPPKVAISINY
jgi:hypothetical protein